MSEQSRTLIWILVALVLLIAVIPLLMWGFWGGYMPWNGGMGGMMGYGWGFMFLIPLAFLLLIVLGVYYLVAEPARTDKPRPSGRQTALEILKERYARGEITAEEYARMKKELES